MALTAYLVAFALVIVGLVLTSTGHRRPPNKNVHYPPGPSGKPLIGNLLDIPFKHPWIQFQTWAARYGPLMRLSIAGREHYVVSTEKIANDLLRERGNLYSSREQLPAAAKLLSDDLRPLFLPYNDTWREGRKFMHQVTNTTVALQYEPTERLESARMLVDLIRSPAEYELWFERYASGIISRLAFGKPCVTGREETIRRIYDVVRQVERVGAVGAYLVDTLPWMMYLPRPLAPFKRELEGLHQKELVLFRGLLNDVKQEMQGGTAPPCWERDYLERKDEFRLTEDEGAYVVGTLFEAGAATTAGAIMSFLLSMVHYPEWLHKIQTEVDLVCGASRLPTLQDMPQLPTVRAVAKEVLRWRPVAAGGVPHQLIKDDVYQNFFLPAGTNIHPNQWAIHRDPELYPDGENFRPERWLEPSFPTYREPLTTYPNLHNFSAFGFGRRICPGQNIAQDSLYILIARVGWACDISTAKGQNGEPIIPPLYDYTVGFNAQPNNFPFELTARSAERLKMVEAEVISNSETDPLKGRDCELKSLRTN